MRNDHGLIVCGARHFDLIMRACIEKMDMVNRNADWEQGFIDQRGNFLTRQDAHVIATNSGQIVRRCGGDENKLFSENLY